MGFGGMLAGSLLASVAGTFLGSTIAHSFFDHHPYDEGLSEAGVLDPEPYEDTADADMGDDFDGGDQRRLNPTIGLDNRLRAIRDCIVNGYSISSVAVRLFGRLLRCVGKRQVSLRTTTSSVGSGQGAALQPATGRSTARF